MEKELALAALEDSKRWFETAVASGKNGHYNIGLYSLEMAVEIALKAVLINLNINYPKVHDIMPTFTNAVAKNKGKLPARFIESESKIMETFRELLKRRGAAGYTFSSEIKIADLEGDFKRYSPATKDVIELCEEAVRYKEL